MYFIRIAAGVVALTVLAFGQHFGIEISSDAQPNCWRTESIVADATKGAKSDREKALALYRFGMSHIIHFNGPVEQDGLYVTDPTKIVGVYGYALCGNNSSAMTALYDAAGLKSRVRWFTYHEVPEVWFEGAWHYLDSDMFGYVFMDDGKTIAGVDDLVRDADLFVRQKNPPDPYFPFDGKADMASVFRNAYNRKNYHAHADTHRMRLGLRTGESVRMFYRPQGRFYLREGLPHDLGTVWKDYWPLGAVREGSLAWTDESPAAYGNALFEYKPDLKAASFRDQNSAATNIISCADDKSPALCAESGSVASLVIDVDTPWVIAGLQNDLSNFEDNTDGARVSGQFWRLSEDDRNVISVSVDGGNTWKEVWRNPLLGAVPFQVDFTTLVEGFSSYKLRLEWSDIAKTGRTGIDKLAIRTWAQLSPMALPRIVSGENEFRTSVSGERVQFRNSAWHRKEAMPGEVRENLAESAEAPYLRPRDTGQAGILRFAAPPSPSAKELLVSVLAHALPGTDPREARVALSISEDAGNSWRVLERFTPNAEQEEDRMWFNYSLPRSSGVSAETLLKVEVKHAGLERVASSVVSAEDAAAADTLRVTHVWMEGEETKTASRTLTLKDGAGSYELSAGKGAIRNRELLIEAVAK